MKIIDFLETELNITSKEICSWTGANKQMLYSWRHGIRPIPESKAKIISENTGISVNYLKNTRTDLSPVDKVKIKQEICERKIEESTVIIDGEHYTDNLVTDEMLMLSTELTEEKLFNRIRIIGRSCETDSIDDLASSIKDTVKIFNRLCSIIEKSDDFICVRSFLTIMGVVAGNTDPEFMEPWEFEIYRLFMSHYREILKQREDNLKEAEKMKNYDDELFS